MSTQQTATQTARRLAQSVRDLADMTIDALEDSYSTASEQGGSDENPEGRRFYARVCNLIDAVGTFRFGDEWERRKYGDATQIAVIDIPASPLDRLITDGFAPTGYGSDKTAGA
jgi:hypothetical protein